MITSSEEQEQQVGHQDWSPLSSHGVALLFVAKEPNSTIRDIARNMRLTQRTVYTLINDLVAAEMVRESRSGRAKAYVVNGDALCSQPPGPDVPLHTFLAALEPDG